MEKTTQFSVNVINGDFYELSRYYKFDLPTGETKVSSCKTHIYLCDESLNKTLCDELPAQRVKEIVNPWF